jgi:hypothetical protein
VSATADTQTGKYAQLPRSGSRVQIPHPARVLEFQGHHDRGTEAGRGGPGDAPEAGRELRRWGRWLVRDVMTTDVVTADRNMPYKQAV